MLRHRLNLFKNIFDDRAPNNNNNAMPIITLANQ